MARTGVQIDGLKEMQAAFRRLDPVVREAMADAAYVTAMEVARLAKANLRPGHGFRTGQLQRALGASVNRRTGEARAGIRKGFNRAVAGAGGSALRSRGARLHVPTKIGHLVEFGHGGRPSARPHPFMRPAYENQKGPFLDRARRAGKVIEDRMRAPASTPGGRFL